MRWRTGGPAPLLHPRRAAAIQTTCTARSTRVRPHRPIRINEIHVTH